MNIRSFHDPVSGTFTYLVDDGHGVCAVIDPVMGFDAASGRRNPAPACPVAEAIEAEGLRVEWLLETHAHADHLSAGPWLQERVGGKLGIGRHITEVQEVFKGVFNLRDLTPDGSQFDRLFADGERFQVGALEMEVLHVPGHTPADVAYRAIDPQGGSDAVFIGDTLFMPYAGTARCDFPGGDAHVLFRSARRLLSLPAQTRLYVCHDYPAEGGVARALATVAEHRETNVHVREGVAEADFVARRTARDATLGMPHLMLPSVQVNVRAGRLPPADDNGRVYLRLPVDAF